MIFDTLFALDTAFKPQPQMVGAHEISPDRLRYSFTLRVGQVTADVFKYRGTDRGPRPAVTHAIFRCSGGSRGISCLLDRKSCAPPLTQTRKRCRGPVLRLGRHRCKGWGTRGQATNGQNAQPLMGPLSMRCSFGFTSIPSLCNRVNFRERMLSAISVTVGARDPPDTT